MTTFDANEKWFIKLEGKSFAGGKVTVIFGGFSTADEISKYRLTAGSFVSGNGDSKDDWLHHNGSAFSTHDQDNDLSDLNCAITYNGNGWWHNRCFEVNFNGRYSPQESVEPARGLLWVSFRGWTSSLKETSMAIRPPSSLLP